MLIGDYNEILHQEERAENSRLSGSVQDFKDWIENLGLMDVVLARSKFTWRRNNSMSKIDKALI